MQLSNYGPNKHPPSSPLCYFFLLRFFIGLQTFEISNSQQYSQFGIQNLKYCQYSFTQIHSHNVFILISRFNQNPNWYYNSPPTYKKVHQALYIRCKTKPSLLKGKCGRKFWRNRRVVSFFQYSMHPICQNIIILVISYYNMHHISMFMSLCWILIEIALHKANKLAWQQQSVSFIEIQPFVSTI